MTQLDTLKKVMNNRTMGICYHGRSASILEECIEEFRGFDICWAGINDFWVMEKHILSKIDERFDIIICSAKENNVPDNPHYRFLSRQEDNLLVLDQDSIHGEKVEFKKIWSDKLFFFTADRSNDAFKHPDKEHPLHFFAQASFSILVLLGVIGEAKRIILFGTEGVTLQDDETYPQYPKRNEGGHGQSNRQRLANDTELFKQTFDIILRNTYQTYNLPAIPIIHCGEKSYYGVFPVWSYDECVKSLTQ